MLTGFANWFRSLFASTKKTPIPIAPSAITPTQILPEPVPPMAWGAHVSPEFREKVSQICHRQEIDINSLMACMAFESGRTFSPSITNAAGSGAIGLIQFMRSTALALDTTIKELTQMSAVRQLDYVEKYFRPFKGKLFTLDDTYMAILWPNAVGQPDDYVLFSNSIGSLIRYRQNRGLDGDNDGKVTKKEAADGPSLLLIEGLRPENIG